MEIYIKNSIINILLDIKKIINYIINDNSIFINSTNYNNCTSELYYLLINTLKKLENIYYKYILLHKLGILQDYTNRNEK